MLKIGITGQNGFVGYHLYHTLRLFPEKYECIDFERSFFDDPERMDAFVRQCDVIVHLAGLNRHENPKVIYQTNVDLVKKLADVLTRTSSKAHVLFSSSSQENKDNLYGLSKKEGRNLLSQWASGSGGKFTGMVIPNVFGPFGLPNYNSFIATFCHQLTHGGRPEVKVDNSVQLIYVTELVKEIIEKFKMETSEDCYQVPHTTELKVSDVLVKLKYFKSSYLEKGEIPVLSTPFDYNLFNTYRSYIDNKNYFPVKFTQHTDDRGSFVEVIKLGVGGQVSFSTTASGVTRGNHYHTRKIERFAVIKGKALIQLRKIGSDEVLNFELNGEEPAYVDMPIWYTHNIKNIGDEVLYTNFWINETYDPEDADTFYEDV